MKNSLSLCEISYHNVNFLSWTFKFHITLDQSTICNMFSSSAWNKQVIFIQSVDTYVVQAEPSGETSPCCTQINKRLN